MSPPIEVGPDANNAEANQTRTPPEIRTNKHNRFDGLAARGRRRGAAVRSTVISSCGCIRDPEVDVHRCGDEITDVQAAAAVAAAEHLAASGIRGLFDADTCRAMWPLNHQLAAECFRYSHGEAA